MEPGVPHYFTVNFTEMIAQVTLLGILRNFKDHGVVNFEIEIYGYTIDKQKKFWRKSNHHGDWEITQDEMNKFMNLVAVLAEHGNKDLYFGVIYQKPKTDKVDISVYVVPESDIKKDEE